jgi:dihydroorotase
MVHCEDSAIIAENMRLAKERYGDDPDVVHHAEIRSREACIASSTLAVKLARETGARLHIAHVTTKEELDFVTKTPSPLPLKGENDYQSGIDNNSLQNIPPSPFRGSGEGVCTLEACLPHLLFTSDDYARLGTRIKCNPSVKTAADREALREALNDGRIAVVATDHAPHLLAEKQGGCARAASGMPMVQFSLVAMLQLADEGVLSLPRLVELMCHAPARLFAIEGRGFIREGMKADLALVCRKPWTLTAADIVSRCAWSPLEGRSFNWRVSQTYCNGRLIYDKGAFANDNEHACALTFSAER